MEKKLQIAQHVNLVDEAIVLICNWVNKDNLDEPYERYLEIHQEDHEKYKERFSNIMTMYLDVKEQLTPKKDRIEYYFKARSDDFFTYGMLSIFWDYHNHNNTLPTYEECSSSLAETDRVRFYASLIDFYEFMNTPKEKLQTLTDLIAFLESTSYDKEIKWEALRLFNHQEASYNEVRGILLEVIELLENRYGALIAKLEKEFYDYWIEYQKTKDIIVTIKERLCVTWKDNQAGTIIIPHIFQPFCVSISIDEDNPAKLEVIRIGIMMSNNFVVTGHRMKIEDIVNIGKLLSDKSKVDILERVSKKPCYGKELATELSLTTATISYHVNALLEKSLLKAEVNANKVYYSLNQEKLAAYLEDVKNFFMK